MEYLIDYWNFLIWLLKDRPAFFGRYEDSTVLVVWSWWGLYLHAEAKNRDSDFSVSKLPFQSFSLPALTFSRYPWRNHFFAKAMDSDATAWKRLVDHREAMRAKGAVSITYTTSSGVPSDASTKRHHVDFGERIWPRRADSTIKVEIYLYQMIPAEAPDNLWAYFFNAAITACEKLIAESAKKSESAAKALKVYNWAHSYVTQTPAQQKRTLF